MLAFLAQMIRGDPDGLPDVLGLDPGALKAEKCAGTAVTDLNIVDNQQDIVFIAQFGEFLQPLFSVLNKPDNQN